MTPADTLSFELDPRLAGDTHPVAELPLCRLLLMDDARYPWLILVPRRPGLRELGDLERAARYNLLDEVDLAAQLLEHITRPDKLNIAALGNVVDQLHVHIVARRTDDAAWPRPVWGVGEREPYPQAAAAQFCARLRAALEAVAGS